VPTHISPEDFFAAFLKAWERKRGDARVPVEELFVDGGARWTSVVCGESPGAEMPQPLIALTIEELAAQYPGIAYDRERHKVDAFARIPRPSVAGAPTSYLDYFNVAMIEVENSVTDSVEEFWKLLHSRVPLKVLITYDYNRAQNVGRMLGEFSSMHNESVRALGDDVSAYLVIFGGRDGFDEKRSIRWHGHKLVNATFVSLEP
jgi:hypothetical protein